MPLENDLIAREICPLSVKFWLHFLKDLYSLALSDIHAAAKLQNSGAVLCLVGQNPQHALLCIRRGDPSGKQLSKAIGWALKEDRENTT